MNSDQIVIELHRGNLCTFFVLPLLKINKFSFVTKTNFVESYLDQEGTSIFVELIDTVFMEHRMDHHPQFAGLWKRNEGAGRFIQYHIPAGFERDLRMFMQGKYSRMSDKAKDLIRIHSGLAFRCKEPNGDIITDTRLLALDRSPLVKQMWEEQLGVRLDEHAELLSIPGDPKWRQLFIDRTKITQLT